MDLDGREPATVQTRQELAHALTALRLAAGLTVRDLAQQVAAPAATLGGYFAGRHLPGPRQLGLYRSILVACGVTGSAEQQRWVAALTRARLATDGRTTTAKQPRSAPNPAGQPEAELVL